MSGLVKIVCFCEDIAHERFIRTLIQRAAEQQKVAVEVELLNATHGSRVWLEFRQYLRELHESRKPLPNIMVMMTDGNCKRAAQVRMSIEDEVAKANVSIQYLVCAVPDPHIERWYLEDQRALKAVLPKAQPKKLRYKCERDRYKKALRDAICAAGIEPLLGGAEYGEDIAKVLDPNQLDRSFITFWKDLHRVLREIVR